MNTRSEPRFKTETSVLIQVLRGQAEEFEGTIVDASSQGFGVNIKEKVNVGEVVRICNATDYVFAVVRHCAEIEGAYNLGVQRIDEWHAKEETPKEFPKAAATVKPTKTTGYLGDLRTLAIRDLFQKFPMSADSRSKTSKRKAAKSKGTQRKPAAKETGQNPPAAAKAIPEQQTAAAVTSNVAPIAKSPSDPAPTTPVIAPKIESTPTAKSKTLRPLITRPMAIGAAIGIVAVLLLLIGPSVGFRIGIPGLASATESVENVATQAPLETQLANSDNVESKFAADDVIANDALSDQVVKQVVSEDTGASVVESQTERPAEAETAATLPSPTNVAASPSQPTPLVTASSSPGQVVINGVNQSWVTACADGQKVFAKLFDQGVRETIPFQRNAVVRTGRADGVDISLNGSSIGSLGPPGAVRVVELSGTGTRFLEPGSAGDCR